MHKHNWVRRETLDPKGRLIYGYQCKSCFKRDYIDMSSGRPQHHEFKAPEVKQGNSPAEPL